MSGGRGPEDVTASILIIGDEILKGKIADTNSSFLSKRLYRIGVKLSRITVVADDVARIAEEVGPASRRDSFVITSGGIGPTHDDVTYAAVARAFDEELVEHAELADIMKELFPLPDACSSSGLANPALKMAVVPESARLHFLHKSCGQLDSPFPIVSCHNVFVFPGVPQYLRRGFIHLEYLFWNPDRQFFSEDILIRRAEVTLIPVLDRAVREFKDAVAFGSYPQVCSDDDSASCTKLTMESFDQGKIDEAREFFRAALPADAVLDVRDDELVDYAAERVSLILNSPKDSLPPCEKMIRAPILEAVEVIEKSLDSFKLGELCLAFNGGKDCTALLYLLLIALRMRARSGGVGKPAASASPAGCCSSCPLRALYVRCRRPFPEAERFVEETRRRFGLRLIVVDGPIRAGLEQLRTAASSSPSPAGRPEIKAIWMGTRRGDPFSENMKHFQMTDDGWPKFLRVNPILDWKYSHIWSFLRELGLPYCSLYDRGYTSIGTVDNTRPNESLRYVDVGGRERYKPAYLLDDSAAERRGRACPSACPCSVADCCVRPGHSLDMNSADATGVTVIDSDVRGRAEGLECGARSRRTMSKSTVTASAVKNIEIKGVVKFTSERD